MGKNRNVVLKTPDVGSRRPPPAQCHARTDRALRPQEPRQEPPAPATLEALRRHSRQVAARRVRRVQVRPAALSAAPSPLSWH